MIPYILEIIEYKNFYRKNKKKWRKNDMETALNTINFQQMAFTFLGGLGLFLFCIKYMGDGLQIAAGDRLKYILDKYTTSPFLGVLVGIFVTALIQSSSGTSVITIGLVGAGLLTLRQAIGIIMGANIGTTITTFIIGFNISAYALPILFIGAFCLFFVKIEKVNNVGRILFGFGGVFFSLTLMSGAMAPLKYLPAFKDVMVSLSGNPVLGVFIGTTITVLVQASSATISILQNIYQEGLIPLKAALPVLFGDNIGTTITAIIAVIGSNTSAKRLAASHVMFNVIGTLIFLIFLSPFSMFVAKMEQILHLNPKMAIAFAHGSFNMMTTVLLFPFIGVLEYLVVKIIKDKKEDEEEAYKTTLDPALITAPVIALGQVKQELITMTGFALKNFKTSVSYFFDMDEKLFEKVEKREEKINTIDQEITKYLALLSKQDFGEKEGEEIAAYLDLCRDIERVGDHAHGIVKDVKYGISKKFKFSDTAYAEIKELEEIVENMIETATIALKESSIDKAVEVIDLHNKEREKEKKIRKNHIKRLSEQTCEIKAGLSFVDLVLHFTRIADHTRNIAERVLENRV